MEDVEIHYNSQLDKLIISEYGRNVQNLITHAKTIEEDDYRQKFIERIVDLIYQMNPRSKNILEYKDKIWRDIFKIANYDIKVTPPNGITPSEEKDKLVPERLQYPVSEKRFRHYGHNVQVMIKKAIAMEDEDMKKSYTQFIASYMKLAYRTWNREHFVNDNVIKDDLLKLSDNQLSIEDGYLIENLGNNSNSSYKRKPSHHRNNNRNKNNRYRKNNNNNNKYRRRN